MDHRDRRIVFHCETELDRHRLSIQYHHHLSRPPPRGATEESHITTGIGP